MYNLVTSVQSHRIYFCTKNSSSWYSGWQARVIIRISTLAADSSSLTNLGLVTPHGLIDLGNTGSDNGLLPDGIAKPLPELMLIYHHSGPVALPSERFLRKYSCKSGKVSLKIICLRLLPHLPGTNELTLQINETKLENHKTKPHK